MYYRVAIQADASPTWKWKSTILSSLNTLFQFLRLYQALPQDRLRVFSACSREDMDEQLVQENEGLGSNSVTAGQFLQDRMIGIGSREVRRGGSEQVKRENQVTTSIAVATQPSLNESNNEVGALDEHSVSSFDTRRLELEHGAGGDHDVPYTFSLPMSMPQAVAWMKLLAKVRDGELEP